ncbi:MAG: hypothetical protein ACYTGH_11885, partial [Planctomycetota bacterium]
MYRNLSPNRMFFELAKKHTPSQAFDGKTAGDFAAWKETTWPAVKATLGDWPDSVDLNPELVVEWEEDG